MSSRIPRPCSGSSTCPNAGSVRGRCPEHAAELEARRNQERQENRDVYKSARWQRERRAFLRENPWCAWTESRCFDAATDVDHVIPIGAPGVDPWDHTNWQGLCHRHHSVKTSRENRSRAVTATHRHTPSVR